MKFKIFVSYFECPVCNAQLWNISVITRVLGIFIPHSIFSSFIICLFSMIKFMKVGYEIQIWQLTKKCPVCNNYLLNFVEKRSSLNCDHKETNHKQLLFFMCNHIKNVYIGFLIIIIVYKKNQVWCNMNYYNVVNSHWCCTHIKPACRKYFHKMKQLHSVFFIRNLSWWYGLKVS